jgi:hypothetical protein
MKYLPRSGPFSDIFHHEMALHTVQYSTVMGPVHVQAIQRWTIEHAAMGNGAYPVQ